MSGQRQTKQLRLAFGTEEGARPVPATPGGAELPTASDEVESPAVTPSLMEEVCDERI